MPQLAQVLKSSQCSVNLRTLLEAFDRILRQIPTESDIEKRKKLIDKAKNLIERVVEHHILNRAIDWKSINPDCKILIRDTPLIRIARSNILELVEHFFDVIERKKITDPKAFDINILVNHKMDDDATLSALYVSSRLGRNIEIIKLLCDKGADINQKCYQERYVGETPVFAAAESGKLDIVKFFCENGANLQHLADDGCSVLFLAARGGDVDVIRFLCDEKKLDINCVNNQGGIPIFLATEANCFEALRFLIEKGSDIDKIDNGGHNILHHAAQRGYTEITNFLWKRGVNSSLRDTNGRTPFIMAMINNRFKTAEVIIDNGLTQDILDSLLPTFHPESNNCLYYKVVQKSLKDPNLNTLGFGYINVGLRALNEVLQESSILMKLLSSEFNFDLLNTDETDYLLELTQHPDKLREQFKDGASREITNNLIQNFIPRFFPDIRDKITDQVIINSRIKADVQFIDGTKQSEPQPEPYDKAINLLKGLLEQKGINQDNISASKISTLLKDLVLPDDLLQKSFLQEQTRDKILQSEREAIQKAQAIPLEQLLALKTLVIADKMERGEKRKIRGNDIKKDVREQPLPKVTHISNILQLIDINDLQKMIDTSRALKVSNEKLPDHLKSVSKYIIPTDVSNLSIVSKKGLHDIGK